MALSSRTRKFSTVLFFTSSLLLLVAPLLGQQALPTVSADGMAYGKYADIPVSGYTGTADVAVPLYTITDGPLSLPIYLQYHTAGNLVATPASSVGMGWNLNTGGIVTRTVRDMPDDYSLNAYYHKGGDIYYPSNQNDSVWGWDSEPDIFTYAFGNYVGKFFIDANQQVQTVPRADLHIQLVEPGHTSGVHTFQQIIITTPEGVKYKFGQTANQVSVAYDYVAYRRDIIPGEDRTAWHLVEIESADNKHRINIEYFGSAGYGYQTASVCPEEIKYRKTNGTIGTENTCNGSLAEIYHVRTALPERITTLGATESITFSKASRSDVSPYYAGNYYYPYSITGLEIDNGSVCTRWNFQQSYFKNAGTTSAAKRLKLDAVQRISCDGTLAEPAWTFAYRGTTNSDGSVFFPATTDKNLDHWGYYNKVSGGTDNNSFGDITPPTSVIVGGQYTQYGSANRSSAEVPMLQATLREVTYPTGGYLDLDLEANRYQKPTLVTSAFDMTPCSSGCTGTYYTEGNFTLTQEMLDGAGRWNLSVVPEPGYSYGQFLGRVEVRTLGGTLISQVEVNGEYDRGGSLPKVSLSSSDQAMVVGQTYKIRVQYTNARVRFYIEYDKEQGEELCGGLRIKQTKVHDGLAAANDIINTYAYLQKGSTTKTSGKLQRTPRYGYSLNGYTALFTAYSMTPLTSFSGYHVAYERVVINKNGIGQEEFIYDHEEEFPSSQYPIPPPKYKALEGVLKESYSYPQNSTQFTTKSTHTRLSSDSYTTFGNSAASGYIFAGRSFRVYEGGSVVTRSFHTPYTVRTGTYRVSKATTIKDGLTTEVNYTYGSTLLIPTETSITNSNGDVHKTKVTYTGDFYDAGFRTNFLKYNILYIPYKTETYFNGVNVATEDVVYRYFASDGTAPSGTATGKLDVPRPYQTRQLEKTYDATGALVGSGTYQVTQTISEYNGDGLPKIITDAGWAAREYGYTPGKQLSLEKFNNRTIRTYAYDALGGSLLASVTSDGTTTSYAYDKLGRLKTQTDGCRNIVTTHSYHFTTGGTDKNYTEVKVDYPKPSANSALDIVETRSYLDGLGRPIQTVAKKQGPSASEDVIVAQEYDKYGRVYRTYEPFSIANNSGAYQTPSTSWGYTTITYESSPLSRQKSITPPGWSATTYSYGTNTSATDGVKIQGGSGDYPVNTLTKLTTTDGNGNKLIEFFDRIGRKVMSRRTDNSEYSSRQDTYYLYDGKGRLAKVIPPGATASSTDLIYTYLYDGKDQVTEATIPGKEKEEFKYNSRQLLAASRDGKLRADGKWYVYSYDGFGRETKAGFYGSTLPSDLNTIVPAEILVETGFGTQVYDWNKITLLKTKVLGSTSSYLATNNTYTSCGLLQQQTGNNHLLLTPVDGELTTYTYDGAGNVVGSTYTHKAPSQTHTVASASYYDHAGRPTSDNFKVDAGPNRKVHQLVYDHKGNVVTKYQGGTGLSGALAYLQKIDYSFLSNGLLQGININTTTGKLSGTQVGLPANGAAAVTPNPGIPSSTDYDDRDLFYLELYRNQQATGISTSTYPARYNGDIVAVASQVRGRRQHVWAANYDIHDRMRSTGFYQRDHRTATPALYANYDEDVTGYDARGNINALNRQGSYLNSGKYYHQRVDQLTYAYQSGSNRLGAVTDASADSRGYPGGSGSYDYDQNGNVKTEPARGLTLTYNHLNVPTLIQWTDGRKLEMTYDAGGTLLKRITTNAGGTVVEERDFVGGIEYVKSGSSYVLESVHHSEGRILFNGTAQEWQYVLTDHLGNTRLVYADRNGNGIAEVPSEIVQEEHYYPFGMKMEGPWMGGAASSRTKYQYNGIEHLDEFALNVNMAHYRILDPTIGRWWGVDPKAEATMSLTSYGSMNNSPLNLADPQGDIAGPLIALGIQAMLVSGARASSQDQSFVGGALRGGFYFAASSVVTAGIGGIFGQVGTAGKELLRATVHGAAGGGFSMAQGGTFKNGFIAGFSSSLVGSTLHNTSVGVQLFGAGLTGGLSSSLSGGDFASGFFQGAIVSGLNHISHNLASGPPWDVNGDGRLSLEEANRWWRIGKGKAITVSAAKVNLKFLRRMEFADGESRYVQTLHKSVDGLVYGNIEVTHIKGGGFRISPDTYDFNTHAGYSPSTVFRNVANWLGRNLAGSGTPYKINFVGTNYPGQPGGR